MRSAASQHDDMPGTSRVEFVKRGSVPKPDRPQVNRTRIYNRSSLKPLSGSHAEQRGRRIGYRELGTVMVR